MFQLIENEWDFLKSQFVTSNAGRGGKQKLPLVFTEYGVAKELAKQLLELESRYDEHFREVFQAIRELVSERSVPFKRIIGLGKKDV